MRWKLEGDNTPPVISAQRHVSSAHAAGEKVCLPELCVIFEMSMALGCIEQNMPTRLIARELPCFIADSRCIAVEGRPDVCFVGGGYGAPAAVDTLETVRALGAKTVLVVGMCGGFSPEICVGDVVVPQKILCEEGVSFHYMSAPRFALPDAALQNKALAHYSRKGKTWADPTVTCDAFYRQTFAKEEAWRREGCVGVDMEASALLNVAAVYDMPAAAVLLCSDKHPLHPGDPGWEWGNMDFARRKREFVLDAAELALSLR